MPSFRTFAVALTALGPAAVLLGSVPIAHADQTGEPVTIVTANPVEQPSAAIAATAQQRRDHRPKPSGPATAAGKAAADREAAQALKAPAPVLPPDILTGLNFAGLPADLTNTQSSPPDNEGAIGPNSYIQTINTAVRIYNRSTHATIANGSLNQLAGNASSIDSFDPQIIWDATTNRFYYVIDSIFSSTDNRISFGFSKTAAPGNVGSAWCHYSVKYNTPFPDYPKLGDSKDFMLIGVNVFANNSTGGYTGSDIIAVGKPAGTGAISTCPAATSFKQGKAANIKDTNAKRIFTPVPSNQIDDNATGYVVGTANSIPATKLWFLSVTKSGTGAPVFSNAKSVTVPSYAIPPSATQSNGRLIDTSDTRNTQAIQAIDPGNNNAQAFYTQHTVKNGTVAAVRWYEIDPTPATPVVLRTGLITQNGVHYFNAAISPDRANDGTTQKFGNSFVIQYNIASATVAPRILTNSSKSGGALSAPLLVKSGVGPYLDFTCPNSGDVCRWGDYAAATPDPTPTTTGSGEVWATNQYSGVLNPPVGNGNWRTQIFAVQP